MVFHKYFHNKGSLAFNIPASWWKPNNFIKCARPTNSISGGQLKDKDLYFTKLKIKEDMTGKKVKIRKPIRLGNKKR